MTKTTKHYLPDGKVFTGPVHKMGERLMTGKTHTAVSMTVTKTPPKKAKK